MPQPDLAATARAAAERHIGAVTVLADHSWSHGESAVLVVALADGSSFAVKAHRQREHFEREVHAYRRWVPALTGRAPDLLGLDDDQQVMFLSVLAGESVAHLRLDPDEEADAHRQAGRLLRQFHDAEAARPHAGYAIAVRDRLESWIRRARPGLLQESEIENARRLLAVLDELPDPSEVPTHRDWQPRNWHWADGVVSVLDFELARQGIWLEDVKRLFWDEWQGRTDLSAAFFEGYGRDLSPEDSGYLRAISALQHLSTIVWADEHEDEAFAAHGRTALADAARLWR